MIELETERLLLRQWREADINPFAEHHADVEMVRYTGGSCDRDDAWRRLATVVGHWTLRGYGMWVAERKDSGEFAGSVGLWYPEGWPELEIGWWLLRRHQGLGFATEAALRSRLYVYEVLQAKTVVSYIHPDNEHSKRVAERTGARFEKTIELRGSSACVYRHPPA